MYVLSLAWNPRKVNSLNITDLTSEEIREKRRTERQQFKLDRAKALAEAAAEKEAAFAEGREASTIAIPSGATWKPQPAAGPSLPSAPSEQDALEEEPIEEEPIEDVEHLQLTLQEAFFLLWNLDCLTVLDSVTVRFTRLTSCYVLKNDMQDEAMDLKKIWSAFQRVYHPPGLPPSVSSTYDARFDNPFLVHYAAYHYYRSLGWVVKGGIKFCVDYLLYKRGPVFAHAE